MIIFFIILKLIKYIIFLGFNNFLIYCMKAKNITLIIKFF
jgi:hypothetical protein